MVLLELKRHPALSVILWGQRYCVLRMRRPREPILQFTWLVGKKGANNTYECKFCRRRINGQPAMVYAPFSPQRISGCQRKEDWRPLLTEQIRKAIATRIAEQAKKDRKRSFSKVAIQPVINQALSSMSRPSADAAIMQFIVLCGIAPSISSQIYR